MSQQIAEFYAKISADTSQIQASLAALDRKMTESKEKSKGFGGVIGDLKGQFASMLNPTTLAIGAVTALGTAWVSTAKAFEESAIIQAKLNSVLESTGGAAGLTADQLNDMAANMSQVTGIEDDLITNSQAVLLTFTKIGKDAFEPTMQAAMNMSAVLGGDLQGSVIMLGKAMNDFSGFAALKKSGVSFTEEQIKQIEHFKETNDLVGYQNLVLNELSVEFGGAAQAMQDASLKGNQLKNSWGNLGEALGESTAPAVEYFNNGMSNSLNVISAWITESTAANKAADAQADKIAGLAAEFESLGESAYQAGRGGQTMTPAFKEFVNTALENEAAMKKGAEMADYYSRQIVKVGEAAALSEEDLKSLSQANADLISGARDVLDANNDYIQSQGEITAQIAELTAQKQALISQGWWVESDAVRDVQGKIDELNGKYTESADAHAEATQRKLLDMSLEAIALQDGIAGFSEAEAERARLLLEASDAGAAAAFQEQQNMIAVSKLIADGTIAAKDYETVLKRMSDGSYTIDVILSALAAGNFLSGPHTTNTQQTEQGGFAEGGISTGPASGHMELLHGTEAVIPLKNGSIPVQMAGSGGGIDVTAIINELRANRMDETRLARAIVSAIRREV